MKRRGPFKNRDLRHRHDVGGLWSKVGKLQLDFLVGRGLRPGSKLIDIGCGCLRGGLHFIRYLDEGNYYGIDINGRLLDAGYKKELGAGLKRKLPRKNLLAEGRFNTSRFGVEFDFALAHSVFPHLPLNHIRLCLTEAARCLRPGGEFYATFFECPAGRPIELDITHRPGRITTYPDIDPFHYRARDFLWCVEGLPLKMSYIGEWGHPRAQKMLCFKKKMVRKARRRTWQKREQKRVQR